MRKRIREKKARTVISIMLIAVMIFCAACSSSSNTGTEPEDITNVSDSEKKVTAAPEPASPTPEAASPTPEPTSSAQENDRPADNDAGIGNDNDDTGTDDVPNEPEHNENNDPVAEGGDYTDDTDSTDYTDDPSGCLRTSITDRIRNRTMKAKCTTDSSTCLMSSKSKQPGQPELFNGQTLFIV